MIEKKEVYIPIEIKPREFSSQVYLSGELAKNGARVFIGSKSAVDRLVFEKHHNQGVYLYKGGGSQIEKFENISKRVNSIAVLDQEISPALVDYDLIRTRFIAGSLKYVSRLYYVGSELRAEAVKCYTEIDPENILDTGWPRVDLWAPSKLHIWNKEVKEINEKFGDNFILFSADFGANSQMLLEERTKRVELVGAQKTEHLLEVIRKQLRDSYKNFNQFIEFLFQMDADSRIPPIIVRPHPGEDHNIWKEKTKNLKKTKIVYQGDITPWLLASNGLLHRGCTTVIEASVSNVKTGFLANFSVDNNSSIATKLSPKLKNIEDIVRWVNSESVKSYNIDVEKILKSQITFPKEGATGLISGDMMILAGETVSPSKIKNRSVLKKLAIRLVVKIRNKINKVKKSKLRDSKTKLPHQLGKQPKANKMQDGIKSIEAEQLLDLMYPDSNFRVVQVMEDLAVVELDGN